MTKVIFPKKFHEVDSILEFTIHQESSEWPGCSLVAECEADLDYSQLDHCWETYNDGKNSFRVNSLTLKYCHHDVTGSPVGIRIRGTVGMIRNLELEFDSWLCNDPETNKAVSHEKIMNLVEFELDEKAVKV